VADLPDSGLVDAALMERLANDAALMALCPGGVYWSLRPETTPAATAFVLVAYYDGDRVDGFGGPLWETTVYTVKAVILNTSRTPARQAAARIHALLEGQLLDLSDAGYVPMHLARTDRIAFNELDPANKAMWHHHGGLYALMDYPA
jgi:hypothetical protein